MSKLEELIQEFCPNGVEYKMLGDIASISRGGSFQKKDFVDSGIPCIHYGQIYTIYDLYTDKVITYIGEEVGKKSKYAETNDIIMAVTSENVDDVCKCVAWLGKEKVAVSGHTAIIQHNQDTKFLSYYFHSRHFYKQKVKLAHGTKVIEVTPDRLNEVLIPVPPIEVQHEIVRILDNFTELTTQLTIKLKEEFTARKKQYEYYRDSLLNFNYRIEKKSLGEIATIIRGASPRPIKNFLTNSEDGINWIKIGDVAPNSKYITSCQEKITHEGAKKSRFVKKSDFILSNSMSFGRPYILKIDGCIHDGWLSISEFEDSVTADYLYYILVSSSIQREMAKRASFGGAVQNLNADVVKGIEIAIPSFETQNRIVNVLNNFDDICTDLNISLPAEIEARQKQYEYYRDLLLTFVETGNIILPTNH